MSLARLSKTVLEFSPAASDLLSGITSNDLKAPRNAFLDNQGRIVVTFDQHLKDASTLYAVVETAFVARLREHLQKFLKISDTRVTPLAWNVYHDLKGDGPVKEGEISIPQRAGRLLLSPHTRVADVTAEEYLRFRLACRLAVQGIDYDREMLLNLDDPDAVSFTKGCYLGQEIIARVHHRGKPPKRLVVRTVRAAEADAAQLTSRVRDAARETVTGFSFVSNP
jgi:folate-binding protein YgfZ